MRRRAATWLSACAPPDFALPALALIPAYQETEARGNNSVSGHLPYGLVHAKGPGGEAGTDHSTKFHQVKVPFSLTDPANGKVIGAVSVSVEEEQA